MEDSISGIIIFGLIVIATGVLVELIHTYKENKARKKAYRETIRRIRWEVMKKGVE